MWSSKIQLSDSPQGRSPAEFLMFSKKNHSQVQLGTPYTHLILILLFMGLFPMGGCSQSIGVKFTSRSSLEQELLVRSLERALFRLDVTQFVGKSVSLELHALTGDQAFAKEFLTAWLEKNAIQVAKGQKPADIRLKVFANILGVDRYQTLLGIGASQIPIVGFPFPEIALYKHAKNRGRSEIQIYAFDPKTGAFLDEIPAGKGNAKYDNYTLLVFISWTVSDLNKKPEQIE